MKGLVFEKNGKKHLKALEIMQRGKSFFAKVMNEESWMPFDDGSGGKWVHYVEE